MGGVRGGCTAPCYDVARANGIGRGRIIYKVRAREGCGVSIDDEVVILAMNAYVAIDDGTATEGVFALKLWKIIGEQTGGGGIEVVGQVGEVLMVDATREVGCASRLVLEHGIAELYVVRNEGDGISRQGVAAVGGGEGEGTTGKDFSLEIDIAEGSKEAHLSCATQLTVLHE